MASSMGSVMMNWTSELLKQAKKKHRKKMKIAAAKEEELGEWQPWGAVILSAMIDAVPY